MKRIYTLVFPFVALLLGNQALQAQTHWPKSAATGNGDEVKLYQWEPESLQGNLLKAKAAVSIREKDKSEMVFGMAWINAEVRKTDDQLIVESASITALKFPGITDEDRLNDIQAALEGGLNDWQVSFASDNIQKQLDQYEQQQQQADNFNNNPPQIIYRSQPSLLVYIDGEPKLQHNSEWDMDAVINTPFTIVKGKNGQYYLYGNKHWYSAPGATGPYTYLAKRPASLKKVEDAVKATEEKNQRDDQSEVKADESTENVIPEIVVSTRPAELVQSDGEANFKPVSGTSLLYVNNSPNDIFLDMNSQQYYLLLSGRWYSARSLKGEWTYIAADKLPADFARIPEGSPKDNVLASVAGTDEADEARLEAQVPQTAKVDRNNTEAQVQYDGDPVFENIEGLDAAYATNTSSSIIRWHGRYYLVDNGIWFESYNAQGPWEVATVRPAIVAQIPARYPVYHMKYVYIYDVYPDYVYVGYTPGYLNTYVYGPTVVYGTGWYYRPWYHNYYYARPCTWGFGMTYTPWYGWSFGFNISWGWFNYGYPYYYSRPYYWGGWWGPYRYRPAYCWGGSYRYGRNYYGGYYGRYGYRNVTVVNNYYYSSNIYRNRNGVYSRDYRRESFSNRNTAYRGRNGSANFNNNNTVRFERNRAANFNNNRARPEYVNTRPTRMENNGYNSNPTNRSRNTFPERERPNSVGNNGRTDPGTAREARRERVSPTPDYRERERANRSEQPRRMEPQNQPPPRQSAPPARQYEPRNNSRPAPQSSPARMQPAQRQSAPPSARPSRSESRSSGNSSSGSSRGRRGG